MKLFFKNCINKLLHGKNVVFSFSDNLVLSNIYEGNNRIGSRTVFKGYLGYSSYIGEDCNINARIGKFCSIGNYVMTAHSNHPTSGFVSTSPVFYSVHPPVPKSFALEQKFNEYKYADEKKQIPVVVGNDVWIGNRVIILGGVKIGDGAIVATGAVITKDVPPYAIVGGIPAKLIRYRFDENQISILLKTKWWNRSLSWIEKHIDLFENVIDFFEYMKDSPDE